MTLGLQVLRQQIVKVHPLSHPPPLRVYFELVVDKPPIAIETLRLEFDRLGMFWRYGSERMQIWWWRGLLLKTEAARKVRVAVERRRTAKAAKGMRTAGSVQVEASWRAIVTVI